MKHQQIIEIMTIEEKVSLFSGKDIWSSKPVERVGLPSLFLADGPHGLRKQAGAGDHLGLNASIPATCFPTAATVANSWDMALGEEIGKALGDEAVSLGVDVLLGPGLNIKRSPLCGRNFEYYSEDPYLSGKMAASYIRGIQSRHVAACPKHFAANNQELRRMANDSVIDERTLREIYLTGFEIAVKESDPKAIMTSYNMLNGTYTNEDGYLLSHILRDEWGFSGAVITDWGGGNNHIEGIRAGSNLEMPCTGGESDRLLFKAFKNGSISEEIIDKRAEEMVGLIQWTVKGRRKDEGATASISESMALEHHDLARRAAEGSIVLLKNQDSILPVKKNTNLAVIGDFAFKPRYQGAGSSVVNPLRIDNFLEAVGDYGIKMVGAAQGYRRNEEEDRKLVEEALALASKADVVICCIGLEESMESEGVDRSHMDLHPKQINLLKSLSKVNANVIAVIAGGSSITMPWIDSCKAVLHGYLSGQAGANALFRILIGEVNPSGKLAETYPLCHEDTPAAAYWHSKDITSEYREGIYVGYRYYSTIDKPVQFPFGYGLSYTSFEYSELDINSEKVTFKLKNIGTRAGAEIAQLYIGKPDSQIFRPSKELKGFAKIFLEPGECAEVTIPFDDKSFRYFDIDSSGWEVEPGSYRVMIGSNIESIMLEDDFILEGTKDSNPYAGKALKNYYKGQVDNVSDEEYEVLLGHSIPNGYWNRSMSLGMNDTLSQMFYAKSRIARLVHHVLTWILLQREAKGNPDLNITFIYNMTFRGMVKMLNGVVTMEMAKQLLVIINGQFFKGLVGFIEAFLKKREARDL